MLPFAVYSQGPLTAIRELTAINPKRSSVTGAASRPIAGKRGSHRYSACLKANDIPVGAGSWVVLASGENKGELDTVDGRDPPHCCPSRKVVHV
jgi:hypothetical protein